MSWWKGKKVLITGGSKGIGRALAEQAAEAGASVVVAARGQADLDATVAAMKARGGAGVYDAVAFDVTDFAATEAGVQAAIAQLGGLDVLVCNSGYARPGYVQDLPIEAFSDQMRVNYLGHVHAVRAALPTLIAQGHGDVALVSSMMGFMGLYGYTAYTASKFAIVGFAQALRQELAVKGVRVGVHYPPTTETPGLEAENAWKPADVWALEADNSFSKTYTADQVAQAMIGSIPKGRFDNMVGADSWFIYTMNRVFPGITRWMADGELRSAIQKTAGKALASKPSEP